MHTHRQLPQGFETLGCSRSIRQVEMETHRARVVKLKVRKTNVEQASEGDADLPIHGDPLVIELPTFR
eukprot:scaffold32914_cov23-Tisochrysis_lutea.AAC.1